jgi:hypothetical protein
MGADMTMAAAEQTSRPHARITLLLCAAAALVEGFDNQSMGVVAPRVVAEFGLSPGWAGVVFSSATFGLLSARRWADASPIISGASER